MRSLDICDAITVQRQRRREDDEIHRKIREQGAESDIQFAPAHSFRLRALCFGVHHRTEIALFFQLQRSLPKK